MEVVCEKIIHLTNERGKAGKRECGKKAFWKFHKGRVLCEHHFNKWLKRQGEDLTTPPDGGEQ